MRDFLFRFRPLNPSPNPSISFPTQNPIGITIKAVSGVSVIETKPTVNIRIRNETFLAISLSEWFSTGSTIFLRTFNSQPIADVICHPNPALAAGFFFEATPIANPSQLYSVEFPPYATHSEGVVIHTDIKEIFRLTDAFQVEFTALQQREFQERERFLLESLPNFHRKIPLNTLTSASGEASTAQTEEENTQTTNHIENGSSA